MSDEVDEAMKAAGLFQVWQPASVGGLEMPFPESLRVFEALGRVDGSAVWVAFTAAASSLMYRRQPEAVVRAQLGGSEVHIVAGGPAVRESAEPVEGGYRVSAQWTFLSGAHHATAVAGFAMITEGGEPLLSAAGMPQIRIMMIPRQAVEFIDTWHVSGLRATGSIDAAVEDLFVPEEDAFEFPFIGRPKSDSCQGPLYHLPIAVHSMALAAGGLGIAQHAIDAFIELASTKTASPPEVPLAEQVPAHATLGAAVAELRAARAWYYETAEAAWAEVIADGDVSEEMRADCLMAGALATKTAASVVDEMQLLGGSSTIYARNPIERCFRDIHALTQHAGTSHRNLEVGGALLLGQPVSNPMLLL